MKNVNVRRQHVLCFLQSMLLPVLGFLLLVSPVSCGRRGDPVLPAPVVETIVDQSVDVPGDRESAQALTEAAEMRAGSEDQIVAVPSAPEGLMAAYTGVAVVLTWDEIIGQGVRMYRVYRSTGKTHYIVGESVTPAFTDKSIEESKVYSYRITAVGISEGPESKEIRVITEKK